MRKRFLFNAIFIFSFSALVFSQNKSNDIPFRMSMRVYATVPHSLSNRAFRMSFTGIFDVVTSWNYQLFKGFNVGFQYRVNEWKTPDNKIPGLNTYAQGHHVGIRVEKDFILSETSTAYVGLAVEDGLVKYFGLTFSPGTDLSTLKTTYYFHTAEFETGMFFYTEGNFAIGMHASVVMTDYQFDPHSIHLDQHRAYIASDMNGNWSHLDVGFIVVYSFLKKK